MATFTGTPANDSLTGTTETDSITGAAGNDTLIGGPGRDFLFGGLGDDWLEAGGQGRNPVTGFLEYQFATNDVLDGGAGNDTAFLDYSNVVFTSTGQPIQIVLTWGQTFQIQIQGFGGSTITNVENGRIFLPNGNDNVRMGAGNDDVRGYGGNDTIFGGAGNDRIFDDEGQFAHQGGDGVDTLILDYRTADFDVNFGLANGQFITNGQLLGQPVPTLYGTATGFEVLDFMGGSGTHRIHGGALADYIGSGGAGSQLFGYGGNDGMELYASASGGAAMFGGQGNDSMRIRGVGAAYGGEGADTLFGGFGNDTLDAGNGNDTISGGALGSDSILAGAGNDLIGFDDDPTSFADSFIDAGSGNDTVYTDGDTGFNTGATIYGGEGIDFIRFGTKIDMFYDAAAVQTVIPDFGIVSGFERFEIRGTFRNETLLGAGLGDILSGGDGEDSLVGRSGNDSIEGGEGADRMFGNEGIDTLVYQFDFVGVQIDLGARTAAGGDAEGDVFAGFENVVGGSRADSITGDDQANRLTGGNGDDTLDGGDGVDTAVFEGRIQDFEFSRDEDGVVSVTGRSVNFVEYTDLLTDIEFVEFGGRRYDLDALVTPAAPNVLSLTGTRTVVEGAATRTYIGFLKAEDPNGDSVTLRIVNDAAARFELVGGFLYVRNGAAFDFEQRRTETLTVRATDDTGRSALLTMRINVTDVNPEVVTGTLLNERLVGGNGADRLNGGGGNDTLSGMRGVDTLTGGTGRDDFVFATRGDANRITDFNPADDRIVLENAVFRGLPNGALAPGAFRLGTLAGDSGDRIIYDRATGALWFDSDGRGGAVRELVVTLDNRPVLTAADIFVI